MPSISEPLTEARMGRRFHAVLKQGLRPLSEFSSVRSEVDFSQGRPDFVGVIANKKSRMTLPRLFARAKIPQSQIARVLTVIQRDESINLIDLAHAADVTIPRTKAIICPLERIGAVCTDISNTIRVIDLDQIAKPDLWAFELKLDDWKRCLFQTLICRSYAERVTAVFPMSKAKHIEKVAPMFETHGIGVMLFDLEEQKIRQVLQTKTLKPRSAYHTWMASFEIQSK